MSVIVNKKTVCRWLILLSMATLMLACAEQSEPPVSSARTSGTYLYITFDKGPNQGRHKYLVSESDGARLFLNYNKSNDVTFFEAKGLVSQDNALTIDSIRRFTRGELILGENLATSWLLGRDGKTPECGRVIQRDRNETQPYKTVFGSFLQCSATTVQFLSDWVDLADGLQKARQVTGQFSDTVSMQMAMDDLPFENFETQVTVEFSITEQAFK